MRWEYRESTDENEVFAKIDKMCGSVAIVLFGVDSELKREVRILCWKHINGLVDGSHREKIVNLERAYKAIRTGRKAIVVMSGDASVWDFHRSDVVKALKRLGAEKVIGIFAKKMLVTKSPEWNEPRIVAMNHLIRAFEMQPPKTEEFDQLFIVNDTS